MQIQPTEKAHLLSDDGELRTDLPDEELAFLDAPFDKSKKNMGFPGKPFIFSNAFWAISILYTGIFYALVVFVASYSGGNRFLTGTVALIAIGVDLVGIVRYWRSNRHVALCFLGGLIGSLVIVPIMIAAVFSWGLNNLHMAL